jgi:hypothetical protein
LSNTLHKLLVEAIDARRAHNTGVDRLIETIRQIAPKHSEEHAELMERIAEAATGEERPAPRGLDVERLTKIIRGERAL